MFGITLPFSCSQENQGPVNFPQTFSFKVESVSYNGGLAHAVYTDSTNGFHIEFYNNPVNENYIFIDIAGSDYLAPDVYALGYDSAKHTSLGMTLFTDGSHPYAATTGSLTITAFDTVNLLMSGQFQFHGQLNNSILRVTQGTFSHLRYRKQ